MVRAASCSRRRASCSPRYRSVSTTTFWRLPFPSYAIRTTWLASHEVAFARGALGWSECVALQRPRSLQAAATPVRTSAETARTSLMSDRPPTRGPIFEPGADGFEAEISGYNLLVRHRPALVVGAAGPADVMAAVRFAAERKL